MTLLARLAQAKGPDEECQRGLCRSPIACSVFGYCRVHNLIAILRARGIE